MDKLDINSKAQELRELLGEDSNSPVDIFTLVNQIEDLTLILYPLGENISGMCVRDSGIKLIAINSTMSYGRQRFSLAHELYHLYYDDESIFNVCSKRLNSKSENEKCADQFASFFLAPYKSLRSEIKKISLNGNLSKQNVIRLEQIFGMSHLAMFWRLVSEGFLSADKLDEYTTCVISSARSLGYDDKLYKPSSADQQKKTYGHYLLLIDELQQKEIVSRGKIDELLLDAFRDDIAFGLIDEKEGGESID